MTVISPAPAPCGCVDYFIGDRLVLTKRIAHADNPTPTGIDYLRRRLTRQEIA